MKHSFRTLWKNDIIKCVCTLDKKCEHAKTCEELEFKIIDNWDPQSFMGHSSYKRKKGAIRQVKRE